MSNNKRKIAIVFFIVFVISFVFSYAFSLSFHGHECIGEDCTICCQIDLIREKLRNCIIVAVAILSLKNVLAYISELKKYIYISYHLTPIALKVKLTE